MGLKQITNWQVHTAYVLFLLICFSSHNNKFDCQQLNNTLVPFLVAKQALTKGAIAIVISNQVRYTFRDKLTEQRDF